MDDILSLAAMEKLLKQAGAKRVGEDAKEQLREILQDYTQVIGKYAVDLAAHADRRTVRASDIKLASRK